MIFFQSNIWTMRDVWCQVLPPLHEDVYWPPSWIHLLSKWFTDSFHKDLLITVWTYCLNSLTHSLIFPSSYWTSSKLWDLWFALRIVPAFLWNLWSSSMWLWFKWHHLFCKFIIFTSYFVLGKRVEVLIYLCINLKITYKRRLIK